MKSAAFQLCRKLLQFPPPPTSATADSGTESTTLNGSMGFNPTPPFDSSIGLAILVLLTAFFFMGVFTAYVRRFLVVAADGSPSPPSHKRGGGLDPSAVESLPLAAYGKDSTARQQYPMIDDCPICLGEFRRGDTVKMIPYCGHVFHPVCLDTWLAAHVTCPLCRSAQLFNRGEESTVDEADTWRCGVRRACSCTELVKPTVALQRSSSF